MQKPSKPLYASLIALVGAASAGLTACSTSDAVDAPKSAAKAGTALSVPVEVVRASRGEMVASYGGTATLQAEADVAATVHLCASR